MSMSDIDKPLPNDAPNVTLTIRMIMNGKEVGSIIGKGGEIINNIREESGAKIHITDGSVPERIVTVTGSTDAIFKSFNMICKKFEDDGPRDKEDSKDNSSNSSSSGSVPRPPVTLRLIVPASQCGSLIGKGGSKIKEIREITGASIQVASEMLPNSTERAVTISGGSKAITQCISQICYVMLESPPKGTTHAYTPKGGMGGGIGNMGGSRHSGGRHQIASHDNPLASLLGLTGSGSGFSGGNLNLAAIASLAGTQIRENRHRGGMDRDHDDRGHGSHSGDRGSTTTYEMSIANDMIGCIIGKGGSKIAEIRQLSGAMIRISKSDDSRRRGGDGDRDGNGGDDGGSRDDNERQITISGNPESVALAKSLINMSLDLHRSKMEERDRDDSGGGSSSRNDRDRGSNSHRDRGDHRGSSYGGGMNAHGGGLGGLGLSGVGLGTSAAANMSQLGLAAQLFAKPELATALTTLVGAGGLGGASGLSLLAGLGALGGAGGGALGGSGSGMSSGGGGHVTGVHRSRGGYGGGSSGGSRGGRDDDRGRDSKRSKFAPY